MTKAEAAAQINFMLDVSDAAFEGDVDSLAAVARLRSALADLATDNEPDEVTIEGAAFPLRLPRAVRVSNFGAALQAAASKAAEALVATASS